MRVGDTIDNGQMKKKGRRIRPSCDRVGVGDNNSTRGGHILHEQEYNTGHGISAIPDEVCGEIWRQPCQPEVQQEPVVHLLLEGALEWDTGVAGLSVKTATQPPQPAHRGSVNWECYLLLKKKEPYKPKSYEQMTYPGQRVQVDVKVVPRSCIPDPELRLFQYTAIDEFTLLRFLAAYPEPSTFLLR